MPEGKYISQLPESTQITDETLFLTDNGEETQQSKAEQIKEYMSGGLLEAANNYTDSKASEVEQEAKSYADTKKDEAVTETKAYADSICPVENLFINGHFEEWQKGDTVTTVNNYTADMWYMWAGTYTTVEKTENGCKIACNGNNNLVQIKEWNDCFNEEGEYTIVLRAKADNPANIAVSLGAGLRPNSGYSKSFVSQSISLTSEWETYFVHVPSAKKEADTFLRCALNMPVTTNIEIAYLALVQGNQTTEPIFIEKNEKEDCRKYYRNDANGYVGFSDSNGTIVMVTVESTKDMRTIPTINFQRDMFKLNGSNISTEFTSANVNSTYRNVLFFYPATAVSINQPCFVRFSKLELDAYIR